ncbi:MAG: hypothetical protein IKU07_10030 [Oscillospiraceae bacterium]|nr:hypothetical protein [Oscillospiraceae bacterium]
MDIKRYVAMTKAELATFPVAEDLPAWMACHFSSYGNGLSNIPDWLPAGSMIILDDRTPPCDHDTDVIAMQLNSLADKYKTDIFLLDFQRKNNHHTENIVKELTTKLRGKVGVTEAYAHCASCAVFITCPLPHQSLPDKLSKWKTRELWLELATETEIITISKGNTTFERVNYSLLTETDLYDEKLKSRYRAAVKENNAKIIIERTSEELSLLLQEAQSLGIKIAAGLCQQLCPK